MPVTLPSRLLGAATAAYGAYTLARPDSLRRTARLDPGPSADVLARTLGARDLASGLALLLAPAGPALTAAVITRITSDATDVVGFGSGATPEGRPVALAAAGGWCALGLACLVALDDDALPRLRR